MDADAAAGRFPAQLMVDKSSRSNITQREYWGTGVRKKGAGLVLCIVCASACPGGGHRGPFPVQAACTQLQRGPPLCCRRPGEVSFNWHKHHSNGAENDQNSCKTVSDWCKIVVVVLSLGSKVSSPTHGLGSADFVW